MQEAYIMAKFYDPICYQLVFIAKSDEPHKELMRDWALETMHDLTPYILDYVRAAKPYDLELSQYGRAISMTCDNVEDELGQFQPNLMKKDFVYTALSNFQRRPPDSMTYNLSAREAKAQKERIMLVSPKMDMRPSAEKILAVSNCPDPLLRTVSFPITSAWSDFFSFYFCCMKNREGVYYHKAEIQLPRVLLDRAGIVFPFQEKWVSRLKSACGQFRYASGAVKMDMTKSHYNALIINGVISDPCSPGIPGYAWGLCLSPVQAEQLRQSGALVGSTPFFKVENLSHGGLYLQLTDDVNRVEREENERMVEFLRPYLQEKCENMMDDLPNSCRLALCPEDIIVDEVRYRLQLP